MITAIFDLDGTIADTLYDLGDAVNYGLRQLECPEHPYESYKKFVGNGREKMCFRAVPNSKKEYTEKLCTLFSEYYEEHFLDKTALYSGISELMKTLSDNGVKLAVATNKPHEFAEKIVKKLLPDIEFEKVLGGCIERPKKPDPAIIRDILDGMPDDNTVYMIGDSNVDIKTAKNSGIISIGCTWGFRSREELESENADFIVDSANEIAEIILR